MNSGYRLPIKAGLLKAEVECRFAKNWEEKEAPLLLSFRIFQFLIRFLL